MKKTYIDHKDDFKTLNLEPLCCLHKNTDDKKTKSILEEIFNLCTNNDFAKSIQEARQLISKETDINLPSLKQTDVTVARNIVFENQKWDWYQSILKKIVNRHSLRGEIYTSNSLSKENNNFEYGINLDLIKSDKKIQEDHW